MTIDAPNFIDPADGVTMTDESIGVISNLASQQLDLEDRIENVESLLKNYKSRHRQIQEVDLPSAMAELGAKSFTLDSGATIKVEDKLDAKITKANESEAYEWLDENGLGGIIKSEVSMTFPKGAAEQCEQAKAVLMEAGIGFAAKRSVHHSTLKSTCKEQIEKGVAIPEALFGIYQYKCTKITTK